MRQALWECEPALSGSGKAGAIDFALAILTNATEAMMRDPALNDRVIRLELHKMLLRYLTPDVAAGVRQS